MCCVSVYTCNWFTCAVHMFLQYLSNTIQLTLTLLLWLVKQVTPQLMKLVQSFLHLFRCVVLVINQLLSWCINGFQTALVCIQLCLKCLVLLDLTLEICRVLEKWTQLNKDIKRPSALSYSVIYATAVSLTSSQVKICISFNVKF